MKRAFLWLVLLSGALFAQKPAFTSAKPTAATVYFNAAEITQRATVTLPAGTSEVVVKNVADYLYESTVQIGAPSTLTVLSVQFTNNYISEFEVDESSPALKKVRDSIIIVQKELEKNRTLRVAEQNTLQMLDKASQQYGSQTGLSVAELTKMVDYYKVKRNECALAINTFNEKEQKLNERLTDLNGRLTVTEKNTEKTSSGKLVLQVMNDVAGPVELNITYLTNNASWTPFYDLRAEGTAQPIDMLYKAQVVQNTGIDWKKVKLTLSSGTPNQNSQAPLLSAWLLRFGQAMMGYNNSNRVMNTLQGKVAGVNVEAAEELEEVVVAGYGIRDKQGIDDFTSISENQLAVTFDIDIPYDILSNGKRHSVTLKEIKLPATYRHYSVPKVEKEAFLLAELSDYSKYNLLRGEANIIFDGMYIGKTYIDPNQVTDTLNLSMGRDKKISVKREKIVDKSGTKFLSGFKEQTFTYEITIRNNKKDAVEIMVKDQYPISTDKEIEAELLQSDKATVNAETGILTWQLKLAPGETKKVRISYRVKYPKDKVIDNL
ncbi:hypothetical protein AM493_15420 [Flavobacterium akiainvivens]|uniref:Mucoidy inhibitor MuiA family protein n=1 Tax=Flavobacterium akiainvivens TaxID=1202724 RepID=A0A0M8MJ48_9FLAO|nr:DUF4139 domain-containing protein [Flavobacterium akiainvivens]KOS07271.1 hypothetical protein AM493_15420 [Flavobacterium akiainvivens]SFQ45994.1 conserved hypothetical protein [Flavobacterium akiainvivens]